ncbi:VgrG-related protein [Gordonia sp. LSe1-13]|uniref:VgrG-related protein n=1 Tax=Gordonia sesuvii TaxID=3116777 RepID=A0ABU7MC02_9ACTN|nr:VgrG-related protein [Gordonia sp. LSe1-13]
MTTTSGLTITVGGSPVPDAVMLQLTSSYVDTNTGLPDAFSLRFRDNARQVLADGGLRVGAPIRIAITTDAASSATELLVGEITAIEAEFEKAGTFTTVRGYDQSHRLFRGRHTAAYTQVTASDAATQCARRAGLRPGRIEPSTTVYEHLSQQAQTDWEFLSALAQGIGYRVGVTSGALDFAPPAPAEEAPGRDPENPLVLRFGTDIVRLRSAISASEQVGRVEVRGWDVATKQPIVAAAQPDSPGARLTDIDAAGLAATFGDRTHVESDRGVRSQAEADACAQARATSIAGSHAEIEAVCTGNPTLRAGTAIALVDLGAPFDGKFVLSSARHRYDPQVGYTTAIAVSAAHNRSMLGLTSVAAPAASSTGVTIAQVTDINDPQQQGRVRLSFPQLSSDYVSGWARTVMAGAGKDRGVLVLPEVGDEVLVAFERGDEMHPYVLGGLFNGIDTPDAKGIELVDSGSGSVNRRSWVSRRGHRIDLHDRDGRDDGVVVATADDALRIELDAVAREITVRSSGTLALRADQGITIDSGSGPLDLRGGRVSVNATTTAEVTASGPVTLQGTPIKLN